MRIVFGGGRPRNCIHQINLARPCEKCFEILERKMLTQKIEVSP